MSEDENQDKNQNKQTLFGRPVPNKRAPLWLRILLMLILLMLAGIGFYYTNQVTFERVLNR